MRIVVTGHTGFLGNNMFDFLRGKKSVEPLGYSRSTGHDILDPKQLGGFVRGSDLVYHFAGHTKPAESIADPVKSLDVNIRGCLNVLEACRKFDVPMVYPSSCEIYGDSDKPIREDFPLRPPNPYAASKAAADRICFAYFKSYGLDVKIVRLFNPYGPRQQKNKVVVNFYLQAKKNEPITVYGDGSDTRDYVYVDDVVNGLWLARKLPPGETVNLATRKATSTLALAEKIRELANSTSEISFVDYPRAFGGIRKQVGSAEKANRLLGWVPKVSLVQGLRKTIDWIEETSI